MEDLRTFSVQGVKQWFCQFQAGKFRRFYGFFEDLDGEDICSLTEEQVKGRCPRMGDVIYNALHKAAKKNPPGQRVVDSKPHDVSDDLGGDIPSALWSHAVSSSDNPSDSSDNTCVRPSQQLHSDSHPENGNKTVPAAPSGLTYHHSVSLAELHSNGSSASTPDGGSPLSDSTCAIRGDVANFKVPTVPHAGPCEVEQVLVFDDHEPSPMAISAERKASISGIARHINGLTEDAKEVFLLNLARQVKFSFLFEEGLEQEYFKSMLRVYHLLSPLTPVSSALRPVLTTPTPSTNGAISAVVASQSPPVPTEADTKAAVGVASHTVSTAEIVEPAMSALSAQESPPISPKTTTASLRPYVEAVRSPAQITNPQVHDAAADGLAKTTKGANDVSVPPEESLANPAILAFIPYAWFGASHSGLSACLLQIFERFGENPSLRFFGAESQFCVVRFTKWTLLDVRDRVIQDEGTGEDPSLRIFQEDVFVKFKQFLPEKAKGKKTNGKKMNGKKMNGGK